MVNEPPGAGREVDELIDRLRSTPVVVTPSSEIRQRGTRRRRTTRLLGGLAAAALVSVSAALIVVVDMDNRSVEIASTAPMSETELVLPDGSLVQLSAPRLDGAGGTIFTVAATQIGVPPSQEPCCNRDVTMLDETALARLDGTDPVEVVSTTERNDGVIVETVSTQKRGTELRFTFGAWVAILPLRDGGTPGMGTDEESQWRDGLTGEASTGGVVLGFPSGWEMGETAAPIASVAGIGIIGPVTKEIQCEGSGRSVGEWIIHAGGSLRLCQADLPLVLAIPTTVDDEVISQISLSVDRRGSLLSDQAPGDDSSVLTTPLALANGPALDLQYPSRLGEVIRRDFLLDVKLLGGGSTGATVTLTDGAFTDLADEWCRRCRVEIESLPNGGLLRRVLAPDPAATSVYFASITYGSWTVQAIGGPDQQTVDEIVRAIGIEPSTGGARVQINSPEYAAEVGVQGVLLTVASHPSVGLIGVNPTCPADLSELVDARCDDGTLLSVEKLIPADEADGPSFTQPPPLSPSELSITRTG